MATKKTASKKQPAADPVLKKAVAAEVKEEVAEAAKELAVVSINADLDPDKLHLHDQRPE